MSCTGCGYRHHAGLRLPQGPVPCPDPLWRQAIASESFKSGSYVSRGQVWRGDHPVVKANRRLFHRPPLLLEAA